MLVIFLSLSLPSSELSPLVTSTKARARWLAYERGGRPVCDGQYASVRRQQASAAAPASPHGGRHASARHG